MEKIIISPMKLAFWLGVSPTTGLDPSDFHPICPAAFTLAFSSSAGVTSFSHMSCGSAPYLKF